MSQKSPPLRERIGDASNVLLLAPALSAEGEDACAELVSLAPLEDEIALSVSFAGDPDERLDVWQTRLDGLPAEVGIVDVNEGTRSAATDAADSRRPATVTVDVVDDPDNLTDVGVALTKYLKQWSGRDAQVVGCVDSLTTLLQYVELQRAFRFLHAVTRRLAEVDAVTHYHLDPAAHDERTINTLKQLFDAVVEVDEDGELTVSVRGG